MPKTGRSLAGPIKVLGAISHLGKVYQLEKYSEKSDIAELSEDWKRLENASTEAFCYFQSFDWCFAFVEQFASHVEPDQLPIPQVLVLRDRDSGEVAMILPLLLLKNRFGLTELVSLSTPLGQYSNVIYCPKAFNLELGQFVFKTIRRSGVADSLVLDHYPAQSMLARIVGDAGFEAEGEHKSAVLDLSKLEDWPSFFATFSKNQRKQLNRRRRNLESLGKVTFNVYPASHQNYRKTVDQCIEMKRLWLAETGRRKGVLFDDRCKSFFGGLTHTCADDGQHKGPIAMALCVDNKPIALELGFAMAGDYYSYLGAIDLEYSKYSPGKLQIEEAQKWALEQGFRYFDFLNDPSAYKNGWTNLTVPLNSRSIAMSFKGYMHSWLGKAMSGRASSEYTTQQTHGIARS